jgi:uncharacterized protein YjbI with pentapeptide repeats
LIIYKSKVSDLICVEFRFDRASRITQSSIINGVFEKSNFKADATDSQFINCSFDNSIYKGGFNECGFTRCKFTNCTFINGNWKNTYFKACLFENCNFLGFKIIGAYVAGFKYKNLISFDVNEVFIDCDIKSVIEIS